MSAARDNACGPARRRLGTLRSYPRNSPQAAARIVALALLADGRLGLAEVRTLQALDAERALGLRPLELHQVVHALCEDLLAHARARGELACHIDRSAMHELLDDVDDPELQAVVLRLCVAVIESDRALCDGEAIVLSAAVDHWGVPGALIRDEAAGAPSAAPPATARAAP